MAAPDKNGFSLRNYFAAGFSNSLAQNTLWAFAGYGLRLIIQATYFIIIARSLGPGQYGAFVAATALANLISPFVGLGSGNLLIKNVARKQELFAEYWGNALLATVVSGLLLVAFAISSSLALLPRSIPFTAILCISVSDLIFVKLIDVAAFAFQAFEMLSKNAHLNVLISLTRLTGIAGLALLVRHPAMQAWSFVYLAGSVLAAVIAVVWVTLRLGWPRLALHRIPGESFEGFAFSTGLSAQTVYNDIDKTMLARLGTLDATGIYSAAYRLIDISFIPVRALLNAALPGFFRNGSAGIAGSLQYGRRLLIRILPYLHLCLPGAHGRRAGRPADSWPAVRERNGSTALVGLASRCSRRSITSRRIH